MSDRDEEGILIGLVSVSDRASSGVYEDKGIPALREWCTAAIETPENQIFQYGKYPILSINYLTYSIS